MYKKISTNDIKDSQNFKDKYFWNRIFFKGLISEEPIEDYLYFDKLDYTRESKTLAEHGNLYNLLINELPSWQNLPLRNNSIVFTNDENVARAFAIPHPKKGKNHAKLFIVIPIIGSDVVVSPESDLWYSFSNFFKSIGINKHIYDLTNFNATFKELADYFGRSRFDANLENFTELISDIQNQKLDTSMMNPYTKIIYDGIVNEGENYLSNLSEKFSPNFNNFKHTTIDGKTKIEGNHELWTNNECLLIEINSFNNLIQSLGINI